MSIIILIYKKGGKHQIINYRPISLTSNLSKVFAKIIKNRIKKQYECTQPEEHILSIFVLHFNKVREKAFLELIAFGIVFYKKTQLYLAEHVFQYLATRRPL